MTLHTFGCSITQGFALPDVVRSITPEEEQALGRPFHWTDVHVLAPSKYAWPAVLAQQLAVPVRNYARRGACFQQIARQCATEVKHIKPQDTVIVMWTYLSRLSLQWPARTSVPFCNMVDTRKTWKSRILPGFNLLFGLSPSAGATDDERIHEFIEKSARSYLDPMGVFNQYYNNLILLTMTDGFLRSTGARVIHLSVEHEPYLAQLESARLALDESLQAPYNIPSPDLWYTTEVDHVSCRLIHDPAIPPAENDMHPSIQHHKNFAEYVHDLYFS